MTLPRRRWIAVGIVCALLALSGASALPPARAQAGNRAAIIVDFGDHAETYCVTFAEAQLSGVELLRRAGLNVIGKPYPGIGEAVCRIQSIGCTFPGDECFCQCMGSPCMFWSYWYWQNNDWVYSGMGASSRQVGNGGIDAWVWGDGQTKPAAPSFDAICAAPTATPSHTATPTPTATSTPTATDTPVPPTPTSEPYDPYPGDDPPPPDPTAGPGDPYPADEPTEEPTWTLVPTWTLLAYTTPNAAARRSATPGSSPTRAPTRAAGPGDTPLPTHTLLDSLQQLIVPYVPGAATPQADAQTATPDGGGQVASAELLAPPTAADVVAIAALISTSVAEARITPQPAPSERSATGNYWLFALLALLLLALVVYAAQIQRQRRRAQDAGCAPRQEAPR